ncbi:hypothetical protein PFJ87_05g02000 [Encephalitozoon hellem]|uniref:Uncharacterized protein n=1 Tax=Encephalitozoon hellem TaxID=27973 RepID=A0ABY8CIJ9_ENCHE|nr:hypothetical protein PFJ87_01g02150 [Encephalitozoon hellem]WEL37974.1 hypothetical protein PFJ87_02g00100 [Encephalitozoon hellem]WEL38729.1 hypothetical protein PFJ87_05g02000 [Encephalitozoon hellem]
MMHHVLHDALKFSPVCFFSPCKFTVEYSCGVSAVFIMRLLENACILLISIDLCNKKERT